MKTIHYTAGYGGNYNYKTICGKEIHNHSETEAATIDPVKVDCEKCRSSKEWKEDFGYSTGQLKEPIRRIFIESDILHADELRDAQREVYALCEQKGTKCTRRVFAEVLEYAWHDLQKTWQAVKKADEIYAVSSLIPLCNDLYIGAPLIFNGMCERALKEDIEGKSVYILNSLEDIDWDMIDLPLMKKAFKKNSLYVFDENHKIKKVNVAKISK